MSLLSKLGPNASSLKQEKLALLYLLTLSEYLPRSRSKSVPCLSQKYNWCVLPFHTSVRSLVRRDCGLACVQMVLRATGDDEWDLESLMKLCPVRRQVWLLTLRVKNCI